MLYDMIANGIPTSVVSYTINLTSISETLLNSTLMPLTCMDGVCLDSIGVSSYCLQGKEINATISAANRLGRGPTSDPVSIGNVTLNIM